MSTIKSGTPNNVTSERSPDVEAGNGYITSLFVYTIPNCMDNGNTKSITFGPEVRTVGENAFSHKCIEKIEFLSPNTQLGNGVFSWCALLHTVRLPPGMSVIPMMAFRGCINLREVILPPGLIGIGDEAFRECVNLGHISIPDTVSEIWDAAFQDCKSLKSVDLPPNGRVRRRAFKGCIALLRVKLRGHRLVDAEAFQHCWSLTVVEFPNNGLLIGPEAFSCCGILTLSLPSSVILSWDTFRSCTSLKSVDFFQCESNPIYSVPPGCFERCDNLATASFPSSVHTIDEYAFRGCYALSDLIAPGLCEIGHNAFKHCHKLRVVDHRMVTYVGEGAFEDCPDLNVVILPKATDIADDTFVNTSVRCLVFGDGMQKISPLNFYNNPLTFVACPNQCLPAFSNGGMFGASHTVEVYTGYSSIIAAHKHRYISAYLKDTVPFPFMFNLLCCLARAWHIKIDDNVPSVERHCSTNRADMLQILPDVSTQVDKLPTLPTEMVFKILSYIQVADTHK